MGFLTGNQFKIGQEVWVIGKTCNFKAKVYGYADDRVRLVTQKRKHLTRSEGDVYLTEAEVCEARRMREIKRLGLFTGFRID